MDEGKLTIIVNVFPLPVCPYAKTVPLYPSRTSSTPVRTSRITDGQIRLTLHDANDEKRRHGQSGISMPKEGNRLFYSVVKDFMLFCAHWEDPVESETILLGT